MASKKIKVLKVKTKHGRSYRRAGHGFSGDESILIVSEHSKKDIATLKADPFLVVNEDEIEAPADPAPIPPGAPAGGNKVPELKDADLKAIAKGQPAAIKELLAKLSDDQLIELQEIEVKGNKRDDVISAIEAELDKR